MFRHLYFLLYFSVFSILVVGQDDSWSLTRAIEYARANNLTVQQSELNQQLQEVLLKQSRYDLLPSLNGFLNHSYYFGRAIDPTTYTFSTDRIGTSNAGIDARVTLFNGFAKRNTLRQNEFSALAAEAAVEATELDITLSVMQAYLQALQAQEQVVISEAQKALADEQVVLTERLVAAGRLTQGNLLELRAQAANEAYLLITAQNQLELALLNLQLLLHLPPSEDFSIVVPEIDPEPSDLAQHPAPEIIVAQALEQLPAMTRAEYEIMGAEYAAKAARGSRYPTLSLVGNITTSYSDARTLFEVESLAFDTIGVVPSTQEPVIAQTPVYRQVFLPFPDQINENFSQMVGLQLSIPIFNNYRYKGAIEQAEIQVQQARLNRDVVENQIRNDVHQAYTNARAAAQQLEAARENVAAMQLAFNYVEARYEEGLINSFEYTTALNNLAFAQSNLLSAKYEYLLMLNILNIYSGKPINF